MSIRFFKLIVVIVTITSITISTALSQDVTPSEYWKDSIVFPYDSFEARGEGENDLGWIKFTLLKDPYDPDIVYFQDSNKYYFHYYFATNELDPYKGITAVEFYDISLYEQYQEVFIGTVITPPYPEHPSIPQTPEYGIQLVRYDRYSVDEIIEMFNKVTAAVQADDNVRAFYFPTTEQYLSEEQVNILAENGIKVGSPDRWISGNVSYSEGWALGRLKYIPTEDIVSAYREGLLKPDDILMTDAVPSEIPIVAGVISLAPSTPNSHVVILANTHSIPFVYLTEQEDIDRANELIDKRIVLSNFIDNKKTIVKLINTEGILSEDQEQELLDLKRPENLTIAPVESFGAYSASTEDLTPADIKYFGGKAANFSILRDSLPENSPVAAAFSFDLWNEFLDQTLSSGITFREHIDSLLTSNVYPPADMAVLSDNLEIIRDMFKDTDVTSFSAEQQEAVLNTLTDARYGFDPEKKIRFRSSTNVEDSEFFVGAGLYDSYSGCLADELDANDNGPCLCDPDKDKERGVFRAIRKVFASFYNDNAYLERLRHGINEHNVGMGILVHHSFPDEIELANGVATLTKLAGAIEINLVTQDGAVSVANPDPGVISEEVLFNLPPDFVSPAPSLQRYSNLVPAGVTVMDWEDDYIALAELLMTAADEFERITGKSGYTLDFEYKKIAPEGKLIVKQIRQLPGNDTSELITPFLIGEPAIFVTKQKELGGDIFALHRCKSIWRLQPKSLWLDEQNLQECFYANVSLDYVDNGRVRNITGEMPLLPRFAHTAGNIDSWSMHHLSNKRTCTLKTTGFPTSAAPSINPFYTLNDFSDIRMFMEVDYTRPVPTWESRIILPPQPEGTTLNDEVELWPMPGALEDDILLSKRISDPDIGVTIYTSFYLQSQPKDPDVIVIWTAPLVRWGHTVITGLTSEPIFLNGFFSQTFKPGHHNAYQTFLFEPRLEENISKYVLRELKAKNIRLIRVTTREPYFSNEKQIVTYGFDEIEESFLSADINEDNKVDIDDLLGLALRWMERTCDECDNADLTGDGNVDLKDLAEFGREYMLNSE